MPWSRSTSKAPAPFGWCTERKSKVPKATSSNHNHFSESFSRAQTGPKAGIPYRPAIRRSRVQTFTIRLLRSAQPVDRKLMWLTMTNTKARPVPCWRAADARGYFAAGRAESPSPRAESPSAGKGTVHEAQNTMRDETKGRSTEGLVAYLYSPDDEHGIIT